MNQQYEINRLRAVISVLEDTEPVCPECQRTIRDGDVKPGGCSTCLRRHNDIGIAAAIRNGYKWDVIECISGRYLLQAFDVHNDYRYGKAFDTVHEAQRWINIIAGKTVKFAVRKGYR